ncbi:MAG TPA: hypothetical protein VFW94_09125 [Candidatus Acidoferrales bacterium]|nr:hypothetical protein [Candidatus Acidoferrales bacterium]
MKLIILSVAVLLGLYALARTYIIASKDRRDAKERRIRQMQQVTKERLERSLEYPNCGDVSRTGQENAKA